MVVAEETKPVAVDPVLDGKPDLDDVVPDLETVEPEPSEPQPAGTEPVQARTEQEQAGTEPEQGPRKNKYSIDTSYVVPEPMDVQSLLNCSGNGDQVLWYYLKNKIKVVVFIRAFHLE